MDRVLLGRTGIEVSRLAIGTGTNGWGGRSQQTELGFEELADLLCFAYDQGITFWDSADGYGSHPHVKKALERVPREKVVITTKTASRTPEAALADVERFRRELGVDTLDILLLHCLLDPEWPTTYAPVLDALSEAKAQGKIRALGCSCHNFGAFQTAAVTPRVEVVLARINAHDLHMDAPHEEVVPVLQQMHDAGKGVYGMKVMGQGELGRDPRAAIAYVMSLPSVDAFTIGMTSREQVLQNVALVDELAARVTVSAGR